MEILILWPVSESYQNLDQKTRSRSLSTGSVHSRFAYVDILYNYMAKLLPQSSKPAEQMHKSEQLSHTCIIPDEDSLYGLKKTHI